MADINESRATSSGPIFSIAFGGLLQRLIYSAEKHLLRGVPMVQSYLTNDAIKMIVMDLAQQLQQVAGLSIEKTLIDMHLKDMNKADEAEEAYYRFLEQMQTEKGRPVREHFPMLSRVISIVVRNWLQFNTAMLRQLIQDMPLLRSQLLCPSDNSGKIMQVDCGKSDRHDGGKATTIFHFESGKAVVYKPRCLKTAVVFTEFLQWVNLRDSTEPLFTPRVLDRGAYGWMEYLVNKPCSDEARVRSFYFKAGKLLRILRLLNARDCHFQNVIAYGSEPVLIDHEMLFQPELPNSTSKGSSLGSIGFLPSVQQKMGFQYDLSAMGGRGGDLLPYRVTLWREINTPQIMSIREHATTRRQQNLPFLDGVPRLLFDYQQSFEHGFKEMHRILVDAQTELLHADSPLLLPKNLEIRYVFRPTRAYTQLRNSCFNPKNLSSQTAFDGRLNLLDRILERPEWSGFVSVIAAEKQALSSLDIPRFTLQAGRRHIFRKCAVLVRNVFPKSSQEYLDRSILNLKTEPLQNYLDEISQKIEQARTCDRMANLSA